MRKWTEEELAADDSVPPQATAAKPKAEETKKSSVSTLQETIELARRGRKEILPKLKQVLDANPQLWQHFGSMTAQTQEIWLGLIAGKDLYLAEALRRHLDAMRSELIGHGASPLDRILADRVLACHLQVCYFDAIEGQHLGGQNAKLDKYRMLRQDQANRQLLAALKTLATVRNLVARTNVIQVELLHPPVAPSPAAPSTPATNGKHPSMHNGHANGAKKESRAGPAQSFNGTNRFTGSRLAGAPEPMGVGEG